MPNTFIFTITAGRTGTAYVAELLRANLSDAEVHHELLGYDSFGVDTPDVSDLMQFNVRGNTEKVRQFWKRKWSRVLNSEAGTYAETAHVLAKAGLVENLASLTQSSRVFLILLRRDVAETVVSLSARFDFINRGNMWMWYLDPAYPKNVINSSSFKKAGLIGQRFWYVCEMLARAEYYRELYADTPRLTFIDADLHELNRPQTIAPWLAKLGVRKAPEEVVVPERQNTSPGRLRDQDIAMIQQLVQATHFSPRDVARKYLDAGRRIGDEEGERPTGTAVETPKLGVDRL